MFQIAEPVTENETNHITSAEANENDDENRVAATSQDVALLNPDQQALVNVREKSTKEKVSFGHLPI